mmetsp:Transcript_86188/g.119617  ORF Transcript_86188/g.119617 Transcript_86188/m.119617 type:complete len:202 (+) Transcript_86188:320-925(+)
MDQEWLLDVLLDYPGPALAINGIPDLLHAVADDDALALICLVPRLHQPHTFLPGSELLKALKPSHKFWVARAGAHHKGQRDGTERVAAVARVVADHRFPQAGLGADEGILFEVVVCSDAHGPCSRLAPLQPDLRLIVVAHNPTLLFLGHGVEEVSDHVLRPQQLYLWSICCSLELHGTGCLLPPAQVAGITRAWKPNSSML